MSSNNQLVIVKKREVYEVHENICVDNPFRCNKNNLLKSFKTLKKAIKFANEYCDTYYVEYGYHIDNSCLKD